MPELDPYRLPTTVAPSRYTLELAPDLAAATFTGTVAIDVEVREPVTEIALALGQHYGVKVLPDFLAKKPGGPQLKNVDDPEKRTELLRRALYIRSDTSVAGCAILLIDDLYRSGATLTVATELLYRAGARKVSVLTMTKTRSKR